MKCCDGISVFPSLHSYFLIFAHLSLFLCLWNTSTLLRSLFLIFAIASHHCLEPKRNAQNAHGIITVKHLALPCPVVLMRWTCKMATENGQKSVRCYVLEWHTCSARPSRVIIKFVEMHQQHREWHSGAGRHTRSSGRAASTNIPYRQAYVKRCSP